MGDDEEEWKKKFLIKIEKDNENDITSPYDVDNFVQVIDGRQIQAEKKRLVNFRNFRINSWINSIKEKLKDLHQNMNQILVHSTNEAMIRNKINTQVILKYFELKNKLKNNDPLLEHKILLYRPYYFYTFYILFIPFFFFNFNLLFLWRLRRDFSFLKCVTLFMFNFFSLYVLFSYTDKWIFYQYLKQPRPYSKFMREEFLKEESRISKNSFNIVLKINKEMNENYNF